MEVERACHCTYRIRYHMVFIVKYRKEMLLKKVGIEYLKNLLIEIGERYWFKYDAIGIEDNHFHIVVGEAPRYSPSRIMQIIKSLTARNIFKDHPTVKEILWGGEFWHDGGHIDTVSEFGGLEKIKKYVKEQGRNIKQMKLQNFK